MAEARRPEVDDLDARPFEVRHHDVLGLEVAVNQVQCVEKGERTQHLQRGGCHWHLRNKSSAVPRAGGVCLTDDGHRRTVPQWAGWGKTATREAGGGRGVNETGTAAVWRQ